jgi:hypothetical protein
MSMDMPHSLVTDILREPELRAVQWQSQWLDECKTAKGKRVAAMRSGRKIRTIQNRVRKLRDEKRKFCQEFCA